MTFLAYLNIAAAILFFGGLFFGKKKGQDRPQSHYGFLLFTIFVMGFTGTLMALGVVELLPEIVW